MAELVQNDDIALKGSPSMMYNNLSTAGQMHCFAHQSDVVVVRPLGPHRLPQKESDKHAVTTANVSFARGRTIVCATSNMVTTLIDGTKEMALSSVQHGPDAETKGTVLVEMGDRLFMAAGHGSGEVSLVEFGADFTPNVFSKIKAHRAAVTAVAGSATSPAMFVSGDCNGELQFWNNQFQPFVSVPLPGECVTSIAIFGAYVVVAYGSGTVRLFLAQTGELRAEIAAHSKWINALAYCPLNNAIATVGDDNLVNVFRMPSEADARIYHLGHKIIKNRLLTGVSFAEDGKTVFVASFDVDKLHSFPFPQ